jgi:hypothetical protein
MTNGKGIREAIAELLPPNNARCIAPPGRIIAGSGRPILDATVRAEQSGGGPRMGMIRMGGEGGDNEEAAHHLPTIARDS